MLKYSYCYDFVINTPKFTILRWKFFILKGFVEVGKIINYIKNHTLRGNCQHKAYTFVYFVDSLFVDRQLPAELRK